MSSKIKADVLQALDAWKSGKPVRSIELGHVHRMIEHPGMSPRIDLSKRIDRDQERAHAYCFQIIERISLMVQPPEDHATFLGWCDGWEIDFRKENPDLTAEEADAAQSLAWKALLVGWKRATDGHPEASYIEVTSVKREKVRK